MNVLHWITSAVKKPILIEFQKVRGTFSTIRLGFPFFLGAVGVDWSESAFWTLTTVLRGDKHKSFNQLRNLTQNIFNINI